MSGKTSIEWTRGDDGVAGATWNPVTGCTKVSPGCDHCYAETFAERWRGIPGHHFENGFDVTLRPERLDQPLRWSKPRRVFVNSMSDLFHDQVPDEFIVQVFAVMAQAEQHTFQLLTKRHGRMRSLLSGDRLRIAVEDTVQAALRWPLPNLWLGVSVEDQHWADIRIPALTRTPATVRFLSCEPLLGPVDIERFLWDGDRDMPGWLHWIIAGGESGPGARPCELDWLRSLRSQCADADVPFFAKQLGSILGRQFGAGPKGGDWDYWPEDVRIREFPRAAEPVTA